MVRSRGAGSAPPLASERVVYSAVRCQSPQERASVHTRLLRRSVPAGWARSTARATRALTAAWPSTAAIEELLRYTSPVEVLSPWIVKENVEMGVRRERL